MLRTVDHRNQKNQISNRHAGNYLKHSNRLNLFGRVSKLLEERKKGIDLLTRKKSLLTKNSESYTNSRYAGVFNRRKSTMSHILVYNVEEFENSMKSKGPRRGRLNRFRDALSYRGGKAYKSFEIKPKKDDEKNDYSREKKGNEIFEFLKAKKKFDGKNGYAGLRSKKVKNTFYRYHDRFITPLSKSEKSEKNGKFEKDIKYDEDHLIKSGLVRRMKLSPLDLLRKIEECKTKIHGKKKYF